jgi:hypothetical protein
MQFLRWKILLPFENEANYKIFIADFQMFALL